MPEVWEAVIVFLNVSTQWRSSGGFIYGMDYLAVKWTMELLEIKKPFQVLQDLQIIEAKVVEIISSRSEK